MSEHRSEVRLGEVQAEPGIADPLTLSFDVECAVEHAFEVWTSRIGTWWPADHTVSGHADVQVILQPRIGGRIFERTSAGTEHDWGQVTVWEPPHRLRYLWHLHRDPAAATEVDIRFLGSGAGATRIEIEHRGWDGLDGTADPWRERNRLGWQTLLPHYVRVVAQGGGGHGGGGGTDSGGGGNR